MAAREEATIASLHEILGDVDVTGVVAVLRRGVDAAEGSGRVLYAGMRSLGWPEDPLGQLWRACELLREHRGDSHMAVWVAAGLSPVAINVLTELWLGMPLGRLHRHAPRVVRDRHRLRRGRARGSGPRRRRRDHNNRTSLRDELEDRTDALEQPIIDAIGDEFEPTAKALDRWSAAIADSGAFPPGSYRSA